MVKIVLFVLFLDLKKYKKGTTNIFLYHGNDDRDSISKNNNHTNIKNNGMEIFLYIGIEKERNNPSTDYSLKDHSFLNKISS